MRTTLNLSDDLMKEVINLTHSKTKTEAVNQALQKFVYQKKVRGTYQSTGQDLFEGELEKIERNGKR